MGWSLRKRLKIQNTSVRILLAEFFATFLFIGVGFCINAQLILTRQKIGTYLSVMWGWGTCLTLAVMIAGNVSGGHVNPAITLAFVCVGKLDWRKIPFYWTGQYAGSFLASVAVYLIYYDAINHFDGGVRQVFGENGTGAIWATYPKPYVSTMNCFGDQIMATAFLVICVVAIIDKHNMNPGNGLAPLYIGLIMFTLGTSFYVNCDYPINPCRDLAPRIFTAIAGWGMTPFSFRNYNWFWVPIVGPHLGGILGAFAYELFIGLHWPDESEPETENLTLQTYRKTNAEPSDKSENENEINK